MLCMYRYFDSMTSYDIYVVYNAYLYTQLPTHMMTDIGLFAFVGGGCCGSNT